MRQDPDLERRLKDLSARTRAYEGASFDAARYPVLRRLERTLREDVAAADREFASRLAQDRPALERLFGPLGPLVSTAAGLSDPHHGGRTVRRVRFRKRTLIYKPRGAATDAAYARLVAWSGLRLPAAVFLDRGRWSWHERLSPPGKGRAWLESCGELLALLSATGAIDVHRENLLSKDGKPVPADLEGLFGFPGGLLWAPLGTGLLPTFRYAGEDALSEVSAGLFGLLRPRTIPKPVFRAGRLVYRVPRGGKVVKVEAGPVLAGFSRAARKLALRRPPLPPRMSARILLRSTRDYLDWLFWSTAPDLLTSEDVFEGALERFAFSPEEKTALRRRDVPVFERPASLPGPGKLSARACAVALSLPSFALRPRRGEPLRALAVAIGEALGELAIETPDGPVWLDLARLGKTGRSTALFADASSLYAGAPGIALFLDELSRQTGRSDFARLARAARSRRNSLGFTDAARRGDPDVLNGEAGHCLALAASGRTREAAALAARFAGKVPEGSGFGHGPAGTAVAFHRLGRGDEARRLLTLARGRAQGGGWCRGDVGLALAEGLIEGTSARPLPPLDRHHLCCGEAGRVAVLARLGRRDEARAGAGALAAFHRAHGAFRFQSFYERPFVPGLMGGISGIGLALLAALDPRAAAVLSLDRPSSK
jgi:lantibiotic modifying enzyme